MADRARTAHVLTVLNLKGGVGKTHTSWVLASVAEEREQRILLIDLDTQGNLSKSFLDSVSLPESVAMLFDPSAEPDVLQLVQRTAFSHIDILPATAGLAPFDLSDQREWEKTDGHLALVDPIRALRSHYDLIVFDCPPRLSLVSYAALCAADFVIVPLEAADWGAQGILQVTEAIDYVRSRNNGRLSLLGYLISRFKRSRSYQRTYAAGMTLSAFRRAIVDTLHAITGLPRPPWDDVQLQDKLNAFDLIVEAHYRYYQFYANAAVAGIVVMSIGVATAQPWSHSPQALIALLITEGVFLAMSRDTLRKYYARTTRLLGTLPPTRKEDNHG